MRIGIDFDNTLTEDAELWLKFIELAESRGHTVVCVTARRPSEENITELEEWMEEHGVEIPTFFTGLKSKIEYMKGRGMPVDIFIDDDPKACALGHV